MKKNKRIVTIVLFSLVINLFSPFSLFAEDTTAAPYEDSEFPQFLHDLRRFEIISLGALPFVTLDASLVYSGIRYAQNDFSSEYMPSLMSSSSFSSDEQIGIVLTSLGISVGIGLTDFLIRFIKRTSEKNKKAIVDEDSIRILPISQDQEAIQIIIPEENVEEVEE